MQGSLFYAKILLFGEYGIIKDSMGLSIPYKSYQGSFVFDDSIESKRSNENLSLFFKYLAEINKKADFPARFNLDLLSDDLDRGMSFQSSIPQGYGVGSSGALVAAIYEKYAINKIYPDNIVRGDVVRLRSIFGKMESFFHGKSSGTDPLICYLKIPLLIKPKGNISTVGIPEDNSKKGTVFLVNSGIPGDTQPMVNIFLEKYKKNSFKKALTKFISYNDACISSFLDGDTRGLFKNIKELSLWVFKHLNLMIPSNVHKIWREGIETDTYYLKLCGSGGGGFILGFTQEIESTRKMLKDYELEIVCNI
ncbi:mevalonate kinase family protein [Ichthyobacterium seriolicida]|uniref:Mevalonate kinase n=1 Tax=Ichthyobacterium seriolicida TaxID=242600 RepID=A0A1J1E5A5_9FLAO|nr:mevalonate kinase [Ichthyobacterium seriolicida]BAV94486.1 mevalonate kinase [Ichthyobacterium seriolicida]